MKIKRSQINEFIIKEVRKGLIEEAFKVSENELENADGVDTSPVTIDSGESFSLIGTKNALIKAAPGIETEPKNGYYLMGFSETVPPDKAGAGGDKYWYVAKAPQGESIKVGTALQPTFEPAGSNNWEWAIVKSPRSTKTSFSKPIFINKTKYPDAQSKLNSAAIAWSDRNAKAIKDLLDTKTAAAADVADTAKADKIKSDELESIKAGFKAASTAWYSVNGLIKLTVKRLKSANLTGMQNADEEAIAGAMLTFAKKADTWMKQYSQSTTADRGIKQLFARSKAIGYNPPSNENDLSDWRFNGSVDPLEALAAEWNSNDTGDLWDQLEDEISGIAKIPQEVQSILSNGWHKSVWSQWD